MVQYDKVLLVRSGISGVPDTASRDKQAVVGQAAATLVSWPQGATIVLIKTPCSRVDDT